VTIFWNNPRLSSSSRCSATAASKSAGVADLYSFYVPSNLLFLDSTNLSARSNWLFPGPENQMLRWLEFATSIFLVKGFYDALWRGAAYLPDRQNLHYNLELRREYGILY
jgi:hypothetical protein